MTYGTDALYSEVAYVAYYFHWSRDEILDMEHQERRRFISEISAINTSITQGG